MQTPLHRRKNVCIGSWLPKVPAHGERRTAPHLRKYGAALLSPDPATYFSDFTCCPVLCVIYVNLGLETCVHLFRQPDIPKHETMNEHSPLTTKPLYVDFSTCDLFMNSSQLYVHFIFLILFSWFTILWLMRQFSGSWLEGNPTRCCDVNWLSLNAHSSNGGTCSA